VSLAGVFLSLCHCGGGSQSSGPARDAKDAFPTDAGSPDVVTFDVRLAVETQREFPVDAAIEVPPATQPEVQVETAVDARDARLSTSDAIDSATNPTDGGVSLDLAPTDGAVNPDLGPITTDARLDGTQDQGAEARATSDVGADTTAVGADLGAIETGGRCNNLDDSVAPLHDEVYADGPVPLPTGGLIADGLYYESVAELYGTGNPAGPAGSQRRMVMRIAGSAIEAAYFTSSTGEHRWESDTMGPSAADAGTGTISLTQVCLGPNPRKLLASDMGYSAVGATLKFIYPTITLSGLWSQAIVLTLIRQ
jgi:hypothetical protein